MNRSASTSEGRFSDLTRQLAVIWIKVKNLLYSLAEGREELFEQLWITWTGQTRGTSKVN